MAVACAIVANPLLFATRDMPCVIVNYGTAAASVLAFRVAGAYSGCPCVNGHHHKRRTRDKSKDEGSPFHSMVLQVMIEMGS
jgi:hypothetical protein